MRDLVATFWRMAFMDRANYCRLLRQLAADNAQAGARHDVVRPSPIEDSIEEQLKQVVYAMLDSGYPFDDINFDRFWPIIVREVAPFGVDAEVIRNDVEADMEEALAQNRRALGME